MKIKILLFHRVSPVRDKLWDPLSPGRFDEIIAHCNKQYTIVPLEDYLLNNHTAHTHKGKDLCAICFDDGYRDFVEYALPVLQKYNTPASMYIVTNCAQTGLPPWTYILDYLFQHTGKLQNIAADGLPDTLKATTWASNEERLAYGSKLKPYLKTLGNTKRVDYLNRYIQHFNDVQVPANLMMSVDEIKYIHGEGIHIGSHTHTHPMLGRIESAEEVTAELTQSYSLLKQWLGVAPVTISYPIGSYNDTVKKLSAQAGYKIGLAVNQRGYNSEKNDIFEIPRIEVYNEPLLKSKLRINGTISWLQTLLRR
jgi:peptidoglycan/xylan/chitin deacetylase (PgdA/CDA1 family)